VDEVGRDGGEAGVDETFDSLLGFIELLELLGSVEGLLSGVRDAHGWRLRVSSLTDRSVVLQGKRKGSTVRGRDTSHIHYIEKKLARDSHRVLLIFFYGILTGIKIKLIKDIDSQIKGQI